MSFEEIVLRRAAKTGDPIEESAYAGGLRGVDLMLQHCGELGVDVWASRGGTKSLPQEAGSRTGTIAHGGFASGQSEWAKVGNSLKVVLMCGEKLAPPDSSVHTEARAIPRYSKAGCGDAVFSGAGGDVGLMMLDLY
jgi:hypothetical protein